MFSGLAHKNAKSAFSNSSSLTSIFKKLRLRDGLVYMDGRPNRKNKASFSNTQARNADGASTFAYVVRQSLL